MTGIAPTILLCVLCLAPLPEGAHIPPPIHVTLTIREGKVRADLLLWASIYEQWWDLKAKECGKLEGPALEKARAAVTATVSNALVLSIDGIPVAPVMKGMRWQAGMQANDFIPYVLISFEYPALAPPRSVSIFWKEFERLENLPTDHVLVFVEDEGDEIIIERLMKTEPEYVWHAPRAPRVGSAADLLEEEPPPPPRKTRLPLVSLSILLAAGLAVPFMRRRGASLPVLLCCTLGALMFSAATWGMAGVEVRMPWDAASSLPSEEEALKIFETLHRNIYRAFDYETEDEIYDALARSVSGDLLDQIYGEVYESLILREEGGAVCKVTSVKVLDSHVEMPEEGSAAASFRVEHHWRVQGTVEHWGHKHLRTNEYRATYLVRRKPDGWRIAGVELKDQRRIGEDVGMFGR